MPRPPYAALDATGLRESILAGERSAEIAVAECFERIDGADGALHAFLVLEREGAAQRARELDAALAAGREPGPLFGVPLALKSNMCWEGVEASCASRILAGWRPPYTASFVERLLAAGAIPVGMTNMDEFAMGSSSENSAFGPTRNPWDSARTPGGSSSGSAVAVAARMVPLALGSDTGGSVRQPAALCGIYGYKPTYGRVSRYGLVAFGSSLDQVSPFARSARDLGRVAAVLSGHDPLDSTSLELPPLEPLSPARPERLDGLRVGVPEEHFPADLEPGVRKACEAALARLAELGCVLTPVRLPHTAHAIAAYYVVATAEASSNLARYDGTLFGLRAPGDGSLLGMMAATREAGFGSEVKRRILLGTYVLSAGYYDAWYGRAQRVRTRIREDFERAFEQVDLIAGPTSPTTAFPLGERADDPVAMYLADTLTVPVSLAGLPAISVPCGFALPPGGGTELPVGLQLVGPALSDARLLDVAAAFEAGSDVHRRAPAALAEGGRP